MLVGESQGFDLKEVWLTQQAIDIDTQRMRGQLAIQPGTQAPKRMGIVFFDAQLPCQLTIDRFNQLADRGMQMFKCLRNLLFLVRAWNGPQVDPILLPEFGCLDRTDVRLVAQHLQIGMFAQ